MCARFITLVLGLMAAWPACADIPAPFGFVPATPLTTDFLRLRMETEGCASINGGSTVDAESKTIAVTYGVSDVCDPDDPADNAPFRLFDIGQLPAGVYVVTVSACGNAPPPVPACNVVASGSVTVFGLAATPVTVPTVSQGGALVLVLLSLLVGLRATRSQPLVADRCINIHHGHRPHPPAAPSP